MGKKWINLTVYKKRCEDGGRQKDLWKVERRLGEVKMEVQGGGVRDEEEELGHGACRRIWGRDREGAVS